MHVVVVVQRVQEIRDVLARRLADFDKILGQITDFRGDDVPAGGFQRFGNVVEVLDFRQKPRALLAGGNFLGFQRLDFLRARFNGIAFGIAIRIGMRGFDGVEAAWEEIARSYERATTQG